MNKLRPYALLLSLGAFTLLAGCGSTVDVEPVTDPATAEPADGDDGDDDDVESQSQEIGECYAPRHCPMTNQEARELAFCLGYGNFPSYTCKGAKIWYRKHALAGLKYITQDTTCHGGGRYWKALPNPRDCGHYITMNHNLTQCLAEK